MSKENIMKQSSVLQFNPASDVYIEKELGLVADPIIEYMTKPQLEKTIAETKKKMERAAKDLLFIDAARLRDEMYALEKLKKEKFG
jgi:excinuclease ABC subunit B